MNKCSCQACGGHIEFPPEYEGMEFACPHCGQGTRVQLPKIQVTPTASTSAEGQPKWERKATGFIDRKVDAYVQKLEKESTHEENVSRMRQIFAEWQGAPGWLKFFFISSKSPESSGWATFFRFIAFISICLGVFVGVKAEGEQAILGAIIFGVNAMLLFFLAFLINCIVDIRFWVKRMSDHQAADSTLLDGQKWE